MKIEERLHDAMHDYADTIEPEPGSWTQISARFDDPLPPTPRPSRRPLALAGVAIAIVVVLIGGLLVRDAGDDSRVATGPGTGDAMPSRILAITADGAPVVLRSKDSLRLDGFATTGVAEGVQIAVGPERNVYLVRGNGNEGCSEHTLVRLPLADGAGIAQFVSANATEPTVSPDGRYLAWLHCLPGDNRADEIVLRDLTTDADRVTKAPTGTFFVNRLEFASDSRHVVFNLFQDSLGHATLRQLDVVGGEAPPGREVGPLGWVGVRGQTGESLMVLPSASPGGPAVATWNPSDSTATSRFTVPDIPSQVVSDASGRHILAVVGHDLYRWSEGDAKPTKLVGNYIGATWIPDPPPAAPVQGTMPSNIIVGVDGRLAVLGAQDGRENSALSAYAGLSSVSSRFNDQVGGNTVLFTSTGQSGACGNEPGPDVNLMTLIADPVQGQQFRNIETRRLVGGAETPVISPNGEFVAYGIACDGHTLGMTKLRNGENFRTDPLGSTTKEASPDVSGVQVLGWSPDSKQLLYRLWLGADAAPRYDVGRLWPAVPQSETDVGDLKVGPDVVAATFVDNKTLVVATNTDRDGVSTVKGFPIESVVDASNPGAVVTTPTLFEVPGRVSSLVADVGGEHFLALTDSGSLYRWSDGDAAPTKLADGVTAAAWLPDPPAPRSEVHFGAEAQIPRDFPSSVPLPVAGPLRAVVSEKNPPNASYTLTYALNDLDAFAVGTEYRDRLERAGFKITSSSGVGGGIDTSMMQFEAIGKKWDVAVVSGKASPRDRSTLSVQAHTHGQPGTGDGVVPTTTLGF